METKRIFNQHAFDQIVESNSKGIQLLQESEFGNGAEIFLEALTLLLGKTKDDQQSHTIAHIPVDVLAQDNSVDEMHFAFSLCADESYIRRAQRGSEQGIIYSVTIPNRNKHFSTLSNDVYQFFDRAIGVDRRGLPDCCETKLLMIGVLSYNVGLAYHLGGVYLCRSRLLTSALEYYNMAFKILDGALGCQLASRGVGTRTKLPLVAALNNIGHIHAYQCSYSFAEEYCEEIAYHLESVGLKVFGSQEEMDIFVQNACLYPRSEEISAAAA